MTVALPAWEALGIAALAVLGASTIAALAVAAVIRKHPAPASPPVPGTAPVPGNAAPPIVAAPHTPLRQPPAPGRIHPEHGVNLLSADFFENGVVQVHDHLRCKTTEFKAPAVDLGQDPDEWLRENTS